MSVPLVRKEGTAETETDLHHRDCSINEALLKFKCAQESREGDMPGPAAYVPTQLPSKKLLLYPSSISVKLGVCQRRTRRRRRRNNRQMYQSLQVYHTYQLDRARRRNS